jgi:hypothetical protein
MLPRIDPLLAGGFKKGGNTTAKDTGSFKKFDAVSAPHCGLRSSNSRQPAADNA